MPASAGAPSLEFTPGIESNTRYGDIMNKTSLWLRWVAANGLAEVVALGIGSIGATIAVNQAIVDPTIISVAVAGVAVSLVGAVAGFVLGWAQWIVLRGSLPTIGARRWVAATTIGGIVSWLLAMTPNTVIGLTASNTGSPPALGIAGLLAIAVAAGAASGVGLSTPQFFVLRSHVKNAGWWLAVNALAWMTATPLFLAVVESSAQTTSLLFALIVTLVAAGITGAIAAAIHGGVLVWLLASHAKNDTHHLEG